MFFSQDISVFKKIFRDIEKLSRKCNHVKCDINIYKCDNIFDCIFLTNKPSVWFSRYPLWKVIEV